MTKQIDQIEAWTRQAVPDVFLGMLSMELSAETPAPFPLEAAGQIIGSVGFIGEATGIIYLYAGINFAKIITARMLGIEDAEVDPGEMVNDAVGELSNMVAGYVKSRLCDAGSQCTLTIPSVVRGQQLSVELSSNVTRRVIGFRNGENQLVAEVMVKESQTKEL
jgi:chemotaxis protein CheX